MGLFSIGGGLLGGALGAFSGNSWQGWDNIGGFLMDGLPGMVGGGLAGFGIGAGIDAMLETKKDMPKAPPPPSAAPKTLLSYEDPAKAPAVKEAGEKSRKAVAAMQGRGATLLTGPGGLKSDEDKPGLFRKTLGGA